MIANCVRGQRQGDDISGPPSGTVERLHCNGDIVSPDTSVAFRLLRADLIAVMGGSFQWEV